MNQKLRYIVRLKLAWMEGSFENIGYRIETETKRDIAASLQQKESKERTVNDCVVHF